jgi:pyruvate formate lyase activating enzyme
MSRIVTLPPGGDRIPEGPRIAGWWHTREDGRIVCDLCPRECALKEGDRGFCFVRQNVGGEMVLTTYGRSTGFCIDPIEKKPLYHFLPGSTVLSFGTIGCNLGCTYCQNWDTTRSREQALLRARASPEQIAEAAENLGCPSVAFTYNDPVIWAEYAIDTAHACRERGIKTAAVTAGYICPEARPAFFAVMDAVNVDLKSFREDFYRHYTLSHLQPVLDTLRWLKEESSVWLEITHLLIPDANDSPEETRQMCEWILANLGDEVPLHLTAFYPAYRLRDRPPTPPETVIAAHDIARKAGLKYVYTGNIPDPDRQSTLCPNCGKVVIERWQAFPDGVRAIRLREGCCAACGQHIAGHFEEGPSFA